MEYVRLVMRKIVMLSELRLPPMLVVCVVVSATASPNFARAQEWQFEPIFKAGVVVDDNATLKDRTDQEVELTGYLLEASANIIYTSSDITSFILQPRVLIRTYPDESVFDSDDFFLRSQFHHRGQSSTFSFLVNIDQQSVRTAERADSDLDIEDPDEIADDDTGRVGLIGDRFRWRLSPSWNYRLSNVSSIDVGLDYFGAQYDKVTALVDYTDARLKFNYRRSVSDTTNGVLTLTGRRYEPDSSLDDNTGYGVLVGLEHALSEKTRLVAMVGVETTEHSSGQSDSDVIGNVTLIRDHETIRMFARYQRSVAGNGAGRIEVRDTVNMNFNRRLNEKISAGFGVRAYHAKEVGSSSSIGDRNYVQLQTKFTWYLSKVFVVEADYRYTIMDRSNPMGDQRSNSNGIGVWFVYQPKTTPKL